MLRQQSGPDALSSELLPTPQALPGARVEAGGHPASGFTEEAFIAPGGPAFSASRASPGASGGSLSPMLSVGTWNLPSHLTGDECLMRRCCVPPRHPFTVRRG